MNRATLTSRQRILKALSLEEPDRVPVDLGGSPCSTMTIEAYKKLRSYLGVKTPPKSLDIASRRVRVDEEVLQRFKIDTRCIFSDPHVEWGTAENPSALLTDGWGIAYERSENGYYFTIREHPLQNADLDELDSYDGPPGFSDGWLDQLSSLARQLKEDSPYAIVGTLNNEGIFELGWFLRGFEGFLNDMLLNPGFFHALMRKVTNIQKRRYGQFLKAVGRYLDVVVVGDDVAMQTGPIVSPELYRRMVKPYHREYFEFIKSLTGAKLMYHCCGDVSSLVDDFIEIGVDALNPVQVSANRMDPAWLKEKYGARIAFWGGIDTHTVLPQASPQEVAEEVHRMIKIMGVGGGYIISAVHSIQYDIPPENVCALFDAAHAHGEYPLA